MHIRRRSRLGRALALLLTASLAGALAVVVAPPAGAHAVPVASGAAERALPPVPRQKVAIPAPATGATTSRVASNLAGYTVSQAVYGFLHAGLGLPLAGSRTLRGTKTGEVITLTVGAPTSVGLPAGVAAPAWGATTIAIDTAAGSLTATATASQPVPGRLAVTIAHAHTSLLPPADRKATLSITANVVGESVPLSGPLTDVAGKPIVALHGTLARARVVRSGVLVVDAGAAVTLATSSGIALKGTATVGSGAARTAVSVAGTVTNPRAWRLRALPTATAATWSPSAGLSVTPSFSGSVVDTAGTVSFDLTSAVRATWTIQHTVSVAATRVEFSDGAPPAGAPPATTGDPWIKVSGVVAVPTGGTSDDLTAPGVVVVDLTTGAANLDATQHDAVSLSAKPAVSLADVTLHATLHTGAAAATGTVTGAAAVTVGSAPAVNATITVTDAGVFVLDFTGQLAPFGLGAPGATGEILYAAADIAGYPVPSTGKTINLVAGFSTTDGSRAGSYTISGSAKQFLDAIGLNLPSTTLNEIPRAQPSGSPNRRPRCRCTCPAATPTCTLAPPRSLSTQPTTP